MDKLNDSYTIVLVRCYLGDNDPTESGLEELDTVNGFYFSISCKEGKNFSESHWLWSNGVKKEVINLVKGVPHGITKTWYRNGKVSGELIFKMGSFVSAKKWKPDGKPCPITNLEDGNGVSASYDEQGNRVKVFEFKNGVQIDEITYKK